MPRSKGRKKKKNRKSKVLLGGKKRILPEKKYKEVFTHLYSVTTIKSSPLWEKSFDFRENVSLNNFIALMEMDFKKLSEQKNIEDLNAIVHNVFDDFIPLTNSTKTRANLKKLDFLIFCWGIFPLQYLNVVSQFHYSYDIFQRTLFNKVLPDNEEPDNSPQYLLCRFIKWELNSFYDASPMVEQWLSQLYYYVYSFGGLTNWADNFSSYSLFILQKKNRFREEDISFCTNLFTYGTVYGKNNIINILEKLIPIHYYSASWKNPKIKGKIGLTMLWLQCIDENEKTTIYQSIIKKGELSIIHQIQATLALITDVTKFDIYKEGLKEKFEELNTVLKTELNDEIDRTYKKAKIFSSVLSFPIKNIVTYGKSREIADLLVSFFNPDKPVTNDSILFISANNEKGFMTCLKNQSIYYKQETRPLIIAAVDAENSFLNATKVIKGISNQNIPEPYDKIGRPNKFQGKKFESALNHLYHFEILKTEIDYGIDSICQFDLNSFPIQGVMLKQLNKTFPINLSLSEKIKFSETRNILFWEGSSTTSETERKLLEKVFTGRITFTVLSAENSNKTEFLSHAHKGEYDIIWISSHGGHEHFEPNKSSIEFSPRESLELREYIKLKNPNEIRRLIFFNTCEGGLHTQTAEFQNLGFPKLMTASNQDVFGHLWMTDSYIAVLFGVLFGIGISYKSLNYFQSYTYATSSLQNGINFIKEELEEFKFLNDLTGLVSRQANFKPSHIAAWGSPAYYI